MSRSIPRATPDNLRRKVRVKAPLSRLLSSPDDWLAKGYAPEICLESWHLDRVTPAELSGLARALDQAGLRPTLHGPFMGLDPGSERALDRDTARRYFDATLRVAEVLRPVSAVFHGGGLSYMTLEQKARWNELSLPLWTDLARSLAELGARLALENVVDHDPRSLLDLVQAAAEHGGGWCFDMGHHNLFDVVGLDPWLDTLGPYLVHLHAHDNLGQQDDHLPLGQGDMDLERIFTRLAGLPEPVACLEVDHRTGVEESLEVLSRIWPW